MDRECVNAAPEHACKREDLGECLARGSEGVVLIHERLVLFLEVHAKFEHLA
eukprot:CAMPEP_0194526976 /NCGR_PEP_ID=MMETSP0253-20130528/62948_1 /TAXON_ID=2966 /ORGANISM="Noctiluca scintillans" /LENGTH=51 /DNA_ID=CAMNT_0039371849 /DNA_START=18 /DNA_END=173 /DNA_ORIENTATION=-